MDAELKAKWIAALRSGEYVQGRGSLMRSYGPHGDLSDGDQHMKYCCLGVLASCVGVKKEEMFSLGSLDGIQKTHLLDENDLKNARMIQVNLIARNDGLKLNFNQIADWIEENL